jgi:hypothetical protein
VPCERSRETDDADLGLWWALRRGAEEGRQIGSFSSEMLPRLSGADRLIERAPRDAARQQ